MALFAAGGSLLPYILPNRIMRMAVCGTAFGIEVAVILKGMKDLNKNKMFYICMMVLMIGFAIIRSEWTALNIMLYVMSLLICVMSVLQIRIDKLAIFVLHIILLLDIVYAIVTVICFLNPQVYLNYFVNLFPESTSRLTRTYYRSGGIAGLTSHYSTNGMFLAIGFLISVSQFYKRKKKAVPFAILFLIALLMCGKRAHVIFSLASLFVLYYCSQVKKGCLSRWGKILGMLFLVGCIVTILYSVAPGLFVFLERFQIEFNDGDVSNGRFKLWRIAGSYFRKNPILGVGWKHFQKLVTQFGYSPGIYDAHNIYLQLLCETGVFGFITYVIWFAGMAVKSYNLYTKSIYTNTFEKYLISFSLAYQTFFLLYGLTGNPLYELYTFIPYFISCAITIQYSEQFNLC